MGTLHRIGAGRFTNCAFAFASKDGKRLEGADPLDPVADWKVHASGLGVLDLETPSSRRSCQDLPKEGLWRNRGKGPISRGDHLFGREEELAEVPMKRSETHLMRIFRRLGVGNRTDPVAKALRTGLVDQPPLSF
jgi:hypothetical protein